MKFRDCWACGHMFQANEKHPCTETSCFGQRINLWPPSLHGRGLVRAHLSQLVGAPRWRSLGSVALSVVSPCRLHESRIWSVCWWTVTSETDEMNLFLNFTLEVWGWLLLHCRRLSWLVFLSSPALCPLEMPSDPEYDCDSQHVSRHCEMSPGQQITPVKKH